MTISFARHQFPPEIIRHAVWLYVDRFVGNIQPALREKILDVAIAERASFR